MTLDFLLTAVVFKLENDMIFLFLRCVYSFVLSGSDMEKVAKGKSIRRL